MGQLCISDLVVVTSTPFWDITQRIVVIP